jgi:filamentous hemagglutinin family protein
MTGKQIDQGNVSVVPPQSSPPMAISLRPPKAVASSGSGIQWEYGACKVIALGLLGSFLAADPGHLGLAAAQVIPDATLPENSLVAPGCTACIIVGGTERGRNLFHSFREFSIPTGGLAVFNNALSVQNILVRVTGANRSSIDGLLTANGSANLFLLNPNGITFGSNAQLLLGGSFLATTGSRFTFADGSEFSATNPQAPSLLAVNVPIGLQLGGAKPPGDIQVQGANLAVATGNTLAFVGGDMTIAGRDNFAAPGLLAGGFPYVSVNGNLIPTTLGGRVELWSVNQGEVAIANPTGELALSPGTGSISFGTLQLLQQARINASGTAGGEIQVQAGKLLINEESSLLSLTTGDQPGRNITVNASEFLQINGVGDYRQRVLDITGLVTSLSFFRTGIYAFSFGTGSAGNITINTPSFSARNSAYVATSSLTGQGGSLTINAPDSINLNEALIATTTGLKDATNPLVVDTSGAGSRLTINTGSLRLENTSILSTIIFSAGRGGDLIVNATRSIDLSSAEPVVFGFDLGGEAAVGGFFSSSIAQADAGNITISTPRLTVRDGASINVSSITQRLAGTLTIHASESVAVFGKTPSGLYSSQITAGAGVAVADGGNVNITTRQLTVSDGAAIGVQASGSGSAGSLKIVASTIALDTHGQINGTTGSGTGGNLDLQANLLFLRHGSRIRTDAGDSNGGNITIQAGFVVAHPIENSDITANALTTGKGGRVNITAQGVYGLRFQPQITPFSDITASSQFGINGTVILNTPSLDPSRGTIELPVNLTDSARQIAQACSPQQQSNRFVVTGRGGLSIDPAERLNGTLVWVEGQGVRGAREPEREKTGSIVEMTGWVRHQDGNTELVVQGDRSLDHPLRSVLGSCHTQHAGERR